MKLTLFDGSRKATVNTRFDECLYLAPRPAKGLSDIVATGKDLYRHVQVKPEKKITYYLHLWSSSNTVKNKILPLSPAMANRFLRIKGLECNLFPKEDPVNRLYSWGYGIAEEF